MNSNYSSRSNSSSNNYLKISKRQVTEIDSKKMSDYDTFLQESDLKKLMTQNQATIKFKSDAILKYKRSGNNPT